MQNKTMLLIEDQKDLLYIYKEFSHTVYDSVLTAETCRSAKKILLNNKIDCIVTDNHLPDGNALSILKELNLMGGEIPIIVIAGFAEKDFLIELLNKNIFYFFEKPFSKDEFIFVLSRSCQHIKTRETYNYLINLYNLSCCLKKLLLEEYKVSRREIEIISYSLHFFNNEYIAKKLFISIGTVKKHLSNIFRKMNISSKGELREFVFEKNRLLNSSD